MRARAKGTMSLPFRPIPPLALIAASLGLGTGSPPSEDPPGLRRFRGGTATFASGLCVELVAVGREPIDGSQNRTGEDRPVWTPSGAPYLGRIAARFPEVRPSDARYLAFRLRCAPPSSLSVLGSSAGEIEIPPSGTTTYGVVVDARDSSRSRCRIAIGTGPWTRIATVAVEGTEWKDETLAAAPWGTLRRIAPTIPQLGNAARLLPRYVVDPPASPPSFAYRVRVVDLQGRPTHASPVQLMQGPTILKPLRIVIEKRPYQWIEFSDVHYDPVPRLWRRRSGATFGKAAG
jgi:hypothetical protein